MARLLGTPLAEALRDLELFTWFSFEQVDEPASDGTASTVVFRSSGSPFRRLARLELTLGPGGTIHSASLIVLRLFIDDPSTGLQAGDLVKSFVQYGDSPAAGDLAGEIMARAMKSSSRPMLIRGAEPLAGGPPSAQYDVFAGESQRGTLGDLTLENRREAPEPALVLTLGSAARAQGWFARLFRQDR